MKVFRPALIAVVCAASASLASAQTSAVETREAVIARQQQEKARAIAPYRPGRAEALFQRFEDRGFPFAGTPPGFYPAIGSVYPGGNIALGAGYRQFTGDSAMVDVHGLYSLATYKRIEATFRSPGHARGRLEFSGRVGWMDAPRISYFGLGSDTGRADVTSFRIEETYVEGGVSWRPVQWFQLSGVGAYEGFDERSGTGTRPSIDTRYTSVTAPRLGEDPTYARGSTTAALLWLDSEAYSRHGGLLRFTYDARTRIDSGGAGAFGMTRTEVVQHIPILRETWVVALRARADMVATGADNAPYFLLPSLGNGSTLRAYQTDRFRDRNSLLLSGEWRWIPSRLALDLALFADAGRVGRTWDDVTSGAMKTDYGIGIRIHTPLATALRIDVARGSEGTRLVFTTSAPF